MKPSPLTCNPSSLKRLVRGELSAAEEASLMEHLGHCAACQASVEELSGGGRWENEVRGWLSDSEHSYFGQSNDDHTRSQFLGERGEFGAERGANAEGRQTLQLVRKMLAPADDPAMIGRLGTYEIAGLIGRGGAGIVLKGFDRALNRYVAIKLLAPHLAGNAAARQRFAREARAIAAVAHEHIVPIHAVEEFLGAPYLVMRYVPGGSLEQRLKKQGPQQLAEILRIGIQTANALAAAHAQGIVHRDVKPANILLESGIERAVLSDFGLARTVDDASETCSGMIAGTPQYMAPEQARGDSIDSRADLFSLGCVMYAMATGHSPFRAETAMGVLHRICNADPRPIRQVRPDLPRWFDELVCKTLLAKDAKRRVESATTLATILERRLAEFQDPSLPPKPTWLGEWLTDAYRISTSRPAQAALMTVLCGVSLVYYWPTQWKPIWKASSQASSPHTVAPDASTSPSEFVDLSGRAIDRERVSIRDEIFRLEQRPRTFAAPVGDEWNFEITDTIRNLEKLENETSSP